MGDSIPVFPEVEVDDGEEGSAISGWNAKTKSPVAK